MVCCAGIRLHIVTGSELEVQISATRDGLLERQVHHASDGVRARGEGRGGGFAASIFVLQAEQAVNRSHVGQPNS